MRAIFVVYRTWNPDTHTSVCRYRHPKASLHSWIYKSPVQILVLAAIKRECAPVAMRVSKKDKSLSSIGVRNKPAQGAQSTTLLSSSSEEQEQH